MRERERARARERENKRQRERENWVSREWSGRGSENERVLKVEGGEKGVDERVCVSVREGLPSLNASHNVSPICGLRHRLRHSSRKH